MDAQLKAIFCATAEEEGFSARYDDESIFVGFSINEEPVELRWDNPESFPYELPTFHLVGDYPDFLKAIPHVAPDGGLCTFDKTESRTNPFNPSGVFIDSIRKAQEVLTLGASGQNKGDYFDEFKAYWSYETSFAGTVFSIANISDSYSELVAAPMKSPHSKSWLIADSKEDLSRFVDEGLKEYRYKKCIYIPLSEEIEFPFPTDKAGWIRTFNSTSEYGPLFERELRRAKGETLFVLFSQPSSNGRVIAALVCNFEALSPRDNAKLSLMKLAYLDDDISDTEYIKTLKDTAQMFKKGMMVRIQVEDLRSSRLVERGGIGSYAGIEHAAIFGCGSLGSLLADAMSKSGVSSFDLIDTDHLLPENFARHLCGFSETGKNKALAVKEHLELNMPSCKCNAVTSDIHTVVESDEFFETPPEVIVLATGTFSTELHVIQALQKRETNIPLVSIWIEPYGIAGHALVFGDLDSLDGIPYDENLEFEGSVVLNGKSLTKRESGCISTYMPYSGADAQIFVNTFLKLFTGRMSDGKNYRFDWYGDLSSSKQYPVVLSENAASKTDYSFEIREMH